MAAGQLIEVKLENFTRVDKDIYYMRTSAGNMRVHGNRIIANTVNNSKKIFKQAIDQYVYALPESTYTRTGNLGRSIRSRNFDKGMGAGEIFVNPATTGANGYFYPQSVEYGLRSKPAYFGRHYWAKGKSMAIADFRKNMKPYAEELAAKLMGR